jgi:hypothetical protein
MVGRHKRLNVQEVRDRAADIRRNWSPLEKLRRTGLPPDIPMKLRQLIMGNSHPGWSTAYSGSESACYQPRHRL